VESNYVEKIYDINDMYTFSVNLEDKQPANKEINANKEDA
jgi:hypothetical protein